MQNRYHLGTEGIKYAGSKLKILPHIFSLLDDLNIQSVFDAFSGTTRVSQAFARNGFQVTSNDISVWSNVFANCYLGNKNEPSSYADLILHLNQVKPESGWFTENYGGIVGDNGSSVQINGQKRLWQIHNTQKLDAIRNEIDKLNLSFQDKCVALTSLILALDEVDNTMGHFTSYLKKWSPRSYKNLELKVPSLFINQIEHSILKGDVFDAIAGRRFDLAYLDPPYGSNNEKMPPSRVRYSSYYHIWTTVCLNDRPQLFGAAQRRVDSSDKVSSSVFEEFRKDNNNHFIAVNAIEKLITEVQAKYVILSYSSGGKATAEELNTILNRNGQILKTIELDYRKNVMAEMKWTNEWLRDTEQPHKEYLFLIEKS